MKTSSSNSGSVAVIWDQIFQTSQVTGPSTAKSFWSTSINTGFRLAICKQGILAVPAGLKSATLLGALAGAQAHVAAESLLRATSQQALVAIADSGDDRWLRFPLSEISRIVCKRDRFGLARHKVIVETRAGKPTRFGFFVRSDFAPTVRVLQGAFGPLVCTA